MLIEERFNLSKLERLLLIHLPISSLFLNQTVAELANYLSQSTLTQMIIPHRDEVADAQLSFAQQRLFFLYSYNPSLGHYNMPTAMHIEGELDLIAFEKSIDSLIKRHDSLRTVFKMNENVEPTIINDISTFNQAMFEYQEIKPNDEQMKLNELQSHRFDLSSGPLFYCKLFKLDERRYLLLMNMHHIIGDEWSWSILNKDLNAFYQAYLEKVSIDLPTLSVTYRDFAIWQRTYLANNFLKTQMTYWLERLEDMETMSISTDRARPDVKTYNGSEYHFFFDETLSHGLNELAKAHDCTLYMVLLAGFSILLSHYSNQRDIVIGSPIANRHYPQVEDIIGLFINTIVMRVKIDGQSIKALLQETKATALEAYANQDLPFEQLVDLLKLTRDESRSPIFDVVFILHDKMQRHHEYNEPYRVTPVELKKLSAKFDITLSIQENATSLSGAFQYNTDLFDRESIAQMLLHLKKIYLGLINRDISHTRF